MKEEEHPREDGEVRPLALWLGVWLLALGFIVALREVAWSVPFPLHAESASFSSEQMEEGLDLEAFPLLPSPGEVPVGSEQPVEKEPSSPFPLEPSDVEVVEAPEQHLPANFPPTRIVIPKIDLDSPILPVGCKVLKEGETEVVRWETADYAVGWHKDSAYPGNGGNIVLSGHHNIKGEVFRYLLDLGQSDEVVLYVSEEPYPYRVAQKVLLRERGMPLEVRRQNANWIAPTDHERLTLVTCWPYSSNTHRLIVVAFPAP